MFLLLFGYVGQSCVSTGCGRALSPCMTCDWCDYFQHQEKQFSNDINVPLWLSAWLMPSIGHFVVQAGVMVAEVGNSYSALGCGLARVMYNDAVIPIAAAFCVLCSRWYSPNQSAEKLPKVGSQCLFLNNENGD